MADTQAAGTPPGAGIDLSQFHQAFFEEAGENLEAMERRLLELDPGSADDEAMNAIFRCAHSVKGGAAAFGFADVAALTHEMETLLDKLRRHDLQPTAAMVDVLLAAGDALEGMLARHQGKGVAAIDTSALVATLRAFVVGGRAAPPRAGAGATATTGAPAAAAAPTARNGPAARADKVGCAEGGTLRVSAAKVDQLINLVGKLAVTQAMLARNGKTIDATVHPQLASGLADLARNTRLLQEAVMSMRMTPMSLVFNRFPRMLRDLAGRLGKKVELVQLGEATELDKGLVEKITDPLTHLVRNSCDHGIETPEVRRAAGKPEHGTITLAASRQGGSVVIEVRDDGRGLNRDKLLAKARERGLDAAHRLTEQEVYALIFAPGFSTADEVSDVSGRGVGMDVVKRNVNALGGTVELDSAEGCGMTVRMRLPSKLIRGAPAAGAGTSCASPHEHAYSMVRSGRYRTQPLARMPFRQG